MVEAMGYEHQHKVDVERFKMDELEERGFRDMLITDREFWHMSMMEDDYEVELWNPVLPFITNLQMLDIFLNLTGLVKLI